MAPSARTWQIVRTVAYALLKKSGNEPRIIVFGLEAQARPDPDFRLDLRLSSASLALKEGAPGEADTGCHVTYVPRPYESFVRLSDLSLPENEHWAETVDAVVGCASLQPCSTAAQFAAVRRVPVWIDVFGDPFSEIQSKAELAPDEEQANDCHYHHVWKLYLPVLLTGDIFSALSARQRYSLIGQLGAAGRLNKMTSAHDLVATIPYAVFPGDAAEPAASQSKGDFVVMWCGSFNTWMDSGSLAEGVVQAMKRNPRLKLMVVGGRIPGYNDSAYAAFTEAVKDSGAESSVRFLDWKPFGEMQKLYPVCDCGLSIDRYTYEAVLGSRTRIVNFLAAGKPVISTVVTELTEELAAKGYVLPFEIGDPEDLARALAEAAGRKDELQEIGRCARGYIFSRFDGVKAGLPLAQWIAAPRFAPDKTATGLPDPANPLTSFWHEAAPGQTV